ncbi:MAG TPA: glycoside hydrolase family 127 protein [Chryseosolibacter sp.]
MSKSIILTILATCALSIATVSLAQEKLYPQMFGLGDASLLEGPFKHARDLNIKVLLEYDADRLLAPFRKEAGLPEKAKGYGNWEGLDGHVGGHYLSALAMSYASTGNADCKKKMDYVVSEIAACQEANSRNHADWGNGYAGGVPKSSAIWSAFKTGDFSEYRAAWVPWYNVHKMYAGLRDAWLYGGNEEAKAIFLKFCDWGITITSGLNDDQMQSMLEVEHGGINEVFADAYQLTKDPKYLKAAQRFSHKMLLNAMSDSTDNLDNKHANTQVPKAVGFQRIAEVSNDETYARAGSFFWETVTTHRTLAFGGNSRREFFPSPAACSDFVNDVEGPETCNTYNMLKLTEHLFRAEPSASYVDFYERALFNHILSSQHPEHGGYVYFTPARPQHYRVYSSPNQAMWCCVGSGMENHSKYNEFIYTHNHDSLFLNLFVASRLNWREKKVKITQETNFPEEEKTILRVDEGNSRFTLMVRYPAWVEDGALQVTVNGKDVQHSAHPSSYIAIHRQWKKGDVVKVMLPMENRIEQLPNVPTYIAILHGPILLGARSGSEKPKDLVADDSRWGHIANGERLPLDKAPILVEDDKAKITQLVPVEGKPLTFKFSTLKILNSSELMLEPFYKIYDARYMIYWMALSQKQYQSYLDSIAAVEKERMLLQKRTIDFVAPGEQQPEADHAMHKENSNTGNHLNEFWRDAKDGGHFSYSLATGGQIGLSLMVRYWGAEWGSRKFDIYIDDQKLVTEDNTGRWNQSKFIDIEYRIPDALIANKKSVRVKFQAHSHNTAGAVYYVRLLRKE